MILLMLQSFPSAIDRIMCERDVFRAPKTKLPRGYLYAG